ncbi:MAG: hypothetical protein ACT452_06835 [Microthrixaceae bacterium]
MNRLYGVAVVAAMAYVGPGLAEQPKQTSPSSDRDAVCSTGASTGSHIKKRVCTTRAERERRAREDQEAMNRVKRGPSGNTANTGP